jgi:hypothetical protein
MNNYILALLLRFSVLAGAVCTFVLIPLWLLRRTRLSVFRKLALAFMLIGALIPIAILPVWSWINAHGSLVEQVGFEHFVIRVWPSSIMLMALDTAGPPQIIFTVAVYSIAILGNIGLYGVVGLCVSWAYIRIRRKGV